MAIAIVFIASLAIGGYYVLSGQINFVTNNWLDLIAWIALGGGALYFWKKENAV